MHNRNGNPTKFELQCRSISRFCAIQILLVLIYFLQPCVTATYLYHPPSSHKFYTYPHPHPPPSSFHPHIHTLHSSPTLAIVIGQQANSILLWSALRSATWSLVDVPFAGTDARTKENKWLTFSKFTRVCESDLTENYLPKPLLVGAYLQTGW